MKGEEDKGEREEGNGPPLSTSDASDGNPSQHSSRKIHHIAVELFADATTWTTKSNTRHLFYVKSCKMHPQSRIDFAMTTSKTSVIQYQLYSVLLHSCLRSIR